MVARYFIEDEYTINVKLRTVASSPPPLDDVECKRVSIAPLLDHFGGGDSGKSIRVEYRHSNPSVAVDEHVTSCVSRQSPSPLISLPPYGSHVTNAGVSSSPSTVPQRANLLVHEGKSVEHCHCEGKQLFMGEAKNVSNVSRGLGSRTRSTSHATAKDRISSQYSEGGHGGSALDEKRKQSKVKMVVVSSGDRNSPVFKPVSGFASFDSQDDLVKSPFKDLTPMPLLSSFSDVVPLQPVEGFVFPHKPRFYTEHTSVLRSSPPKEVEIKPLCLPSVNVFDESDSLVSKNTYTVPKKKQFAPTPKPVGPGSIFVKPIQRHCTTGSGELYVAPVDASLISSTKVSTIPALKGNSRRRKSSSHVEGQQEVKVQERKKSSDGVNISDIRRQCSSKSLMKDEEKSLHRTNNGVKDSTHLMGNRKTSDKGCTLRMEVNPVSKKVAQSVSYKNDHSSNDDKSTHSHLLFQNENKKKLFSSGNVNAIPRKTVVFQSNPQKIIKSSTEGQSSQKNTPHLPSKHANQPKILKGGEHPRTDELLSDQKMAARALLTGVLATKMSPLPSADLKCPVPVQRSQTDYLSKSRELLPSASADTESRDTLRRKSYGTGVSLFVGKSRRVHTAPKKSASALCLPSVELSDGSRKLSLPTSQGDCVPEVYANSGPTTLTPSGHDTHEERVPTSADVTCFDPRDLDNKRGIMLVTNEPVPASHLALPRQRFAPGNNLLSAGRRGDKPNFHAAHPKAGNPRANKYLVTDPIIPGVVATAPSVFEGCENLGFDSSFSQENPGFEATFAYLPFGDSRSLDPGYVSEKSEEEEELEAEAGLEDDESASSSDDESNLPHSFLEPPHGINLDIEYLMKIFPFINEGTMFDVTIIKNSRGLGLALTGGVECDSGLLPGLIRIRKLYPQTPAWLCGQLQVNDFILEANGKQLTGLTSHEALEVLRTAGGEVHLVLCRAPDEVLNGSEESSPTVARDNCVVTTSLTAPLPILGGGGHFLSPSPSFSACGEFEIKLRKVSGSLGFTLRKNDNSILGHTIRSLVKEPAISDGRLRPGDKLLSVNGTDMCGLSHEEAVQFLRTCPESVVLRIYRDAMQTPVSPASPTEPEFCKPKALRKEARDMLTDLAFRKQTSTHSCGNSSTETPTTQRRRRLNKITTPESKEERWESLVREVEENSTTQGPFESREPSPFDNHHSDTLTVTSSRSGTICSGSSSGNSYKEISINPSSNSPSNSSASESRPRRPNFLDLNSSHSSSKKSQFTPPHEELPSPPVVGRQYDSLDSAPQLTSAHSDTPAFSHLQSCYRSVNNASSLSPFIEQRLTNTSSDHNISSYAHNGDSPNKKNALLKWKGVVFTPDEEEENMFVANSSFDTPVSQNSPDTRVVTMELTRGWNSRLGFSLQKEGDETVIVAIYADSVAAKDGRLKVGDVILEVNGNDVKNWDAQSVIELLRKTRGKISLKILKKGT